MTTVQKGNATPRVVRRATGATLGPKERPLWGVGGVLTLLLVMQLVSGTGLVSSASMPTAVDMIVAFANLVVSKTFLTALGNTLLSAVIAFLLALAVGVPLGVFLGTSKRWERFFSGLVELMRPIPAIALMPVAILALGIGLRMKVVLAAYACLWPLLINAIAGVRDTDSTMMMAGRSFVWSRFTILRRIQLPAALPFIASGARQSLSLALVLIVTLELLGARAGLGEVIRQYSAGGQIAYVFAGVLATGLLGLGLHVVLSRAERRLMRWAPQHRRVRS